MPANTRKQRTMAQSLLDSQHERKEGLHSPVNTNAYIRLEQMATYLDLATPAQTQLWLTPPQFKPYFEELYKNAILPRLQKGSTQGPQLKSVRSAITRGESFGD